MTRGESYELQHSFRFYSWCQEKLHFALPARDLELHLDRIVGPEVQGHVRRGADRLHHVREVVQREKRPHGLFGLYLLEQVLRHHSLHVVRLTCLYDIESLLRAREPCAA